MNTARLLIALLGSLLLMGCAFTSASLPVSYDESHATRGPISRTDHGPIMVSQFSDLRKDQERIGYKRNGFGQKTADITTDVPVSDIVRDGLVKALKANGQTLVENNERIRIDGQVTEFWFDIDINFWTVKSMGSVSATLQFIDLNTNQTFHTNDYIGNYELESMAAGLEGAWTNAMELALENMIDSIMTDSELARKLRELSSKEVALLDSHKS